jgi:aspartate-semialdehyde dehydrogenase
VRRRRAAGRKAHVALFDAQSLVAKGVRERLVEREFPIASVHLYTSQADPEANLTEFGGQAMFVSPADFDALAPLDIAFLCGTRPEGALYLDWPGRKGFAAIDLTSASRAAEGVPVVNAAVNPEAIPAAPGLIGTPHPIALVLSTVLSAIRRGCGLEEASMVVLQPVSECGEEGIAELYQQTLGLLNFKDQPRDVFGRQLAFNLVPDFLYGGSGPPGGAATGDLEAEIAQVTGGGFGLSLSIVLAPVFHCHAVMARVVLPPKRGRKDLLAALGAAPDLHLREGGEGVTPVERAGEPGILVAGVRPAGAENAFWLWLVADNLASGTALNAVRIAEVLWQREGVH